MKYILTLILALIAGPALATGFQAGAFNNACGVSANAHFQGQSFRGHGFGVNNRALAIAIAKQQQRDFIRAQQLKALQKQQAFARQARFRQARVGGFANFAGSFLGSLVANQQNRRRGDVIIINRRR